MTGHLITSSAWASSEGSTALKVDPA